jgi:hypothetical protein
MPNPIVEPTTLATHCSRSPPNSVRNARLINGYQNRENPRKYCNEEKRPPHSHVASFVREGPSVVKIKYESERALRIGRLCRCKNPTRFKSYKPSSLSCDPFRAVVKNNVKKKVLIREDMSCFRSPSSPPSFFFLNLYRICLILSGLCISLSDHAQPSLNDTGGLDLEGAAEAGHGAVSVQALALGGRDRSRLGLLLLLLVLAALAPGLVLAVVVLLFLG